MESKKIITRRQAEVLKLIAEGLSNKEVGNRLKISPKTVEKFRGTVYRKAGICSTAQAVHLGLFLKLAKLIEFPGVKLECP